MIIVDRLLIGGLRFVLQRVTDAVAAELDDSDRWKEELLAAQMRLELGEIDDAEYERIEAGVLEQLRDQRGPGGVPISVAGQGATVEVESPHELDE